jgi:hypothetical protein
MIAQRDTIWPALFSANFSLFFGSNLLQLGFLPVEKFANRVRIKTAFFTQRLVEHAC